jgi:hypothetical protein
MSQTTNDKHFHILQCSKCEGVSKILQLFLCGDGQSKGFIAIDQKSRAKLCDALNN